VVAVAFSNSTTCDQVEQWKGLTPGSG